MPEEHWLVVCATGQGIVNLVPAVAIGVEKFTHVLILKGVTDPPNSVVDKAEAHDPASRFEKALETACKLHQKRPELNYCTLEDDKDTPSVWTKKIAEHFKARKPRSKITYVYTGGTRDMMLGIEDALTALEKQGSDVVRVAKQTNRLFWKTTKQQRSLRTGENRVSLDAYLDLYGFIVTPKYMEQKDSNDAIATGRRGATDALFNLLYEGGDPAVTNERINTLKRPKTGERLAEADLLLPLTKISSPAGEGQVTKRAFEEKWNAQLHKYWLGLLTLLRGYDGFSVQPDNCLKVTADAAPGSILKWLRGDWLEEWVWFQVKSALNVTGEQIHLNFKITHHDMMDPKVERLKWQHQAEIDVAIFVDDQLHLIECKSGNETGDSEIDKLLKRGKQVVGRDGLRWLANAHKLKMEKTNYWKALIPRVELFSGLDDLNGLSDELRRRLQPPR